MELEESDKVPSVSLRDDDQVVTSDANLQADIQKVEARENEREHSSQHEDHWGPLTKVVEERNAKDAVHKAMEQAAEDEEASYEQVIGPKATSEPLQEHFESDEVRVHEELVSTEDDDKDLE